MSGEGWVFRNFRKRRRKLPHWEDDGAVYFVTPVTDAAFSGSLTTPELASAIVEVLHHDDGRRYDLHAYVIMPDHMHLLFQPLPRDGSCVSLSEIMHAIKGVSAHRINRLLQREGAVWEVESHDRAVRDEREYHSKWWYIRRNPVRAGLVQTPEDWPWLWPQPE